ncbi:hypothetical protein GCM10010123_04230 [Pilimelia anulata]|uniref:Major facilitator superfamily (MFS) profile domain-containing protein n=1 Tax=Pilimelia anulata TaxID=53371 RepID=A0A8J3B768_9ACTN|nr:MFS transporter [Pilimelia anulata]GGJ77402.1 hypothetical protein GCM10010123_04230 [Pilimelia anulata]
MRPEAVHRRTLRLLFATQTLGAVGVAIGMSVGALLTARIAGTRLSGLAQSGAVVGGALLTIPVTRLTAAHGRRVGLALAYAVGTLGAVLTVTGATVPSLPLLFGGLILFGGGTTANLQARYAAVDLAPADRRGRHLSLIVWATTLGAVAAPLLAPLADRLVADWELAPLSGPFVISAAAFALGGVVLWLLLRPDPLLVARALAAPSAAAPVDAVPLVAPVDPVPLVAPVDSAPPAAVRPAPSAAPGTDRGAPTGIGAPVGPPAAVAAAVGAEPAGPPTPAAPAGAGERLTIRSALPLVAANPYARLGVAAVALGHMIMVGVMSMTPVHLGNHHPAHRVLTLVGIVLSLHIAGMYALSPLLGLLTDRLGSRPVIGIGAVLLAAACLVAGTAGADTTRLAIGLTLLGLGWSGTMVAGSTLLTAHVPLAARPAAQGLSDLVTGLAGAAAGAVSGFVVAGLDFRALALGAGLVTVPLALWTLRPGARPT